MRDTIKPIMKVGRTKVQIANQGYTYNEAGFTYNQAGWQYGGLYEHDIVPMITRAKIEKGNIIAARDVGEIMNNRPGMLIGILGLTYTNYS
jgi:hypothetical protein